MASFTDGEGATWQVRLTVGHLAALRADFGLDPNKMVRSDEEFAKLFDLDPEKLVGALYLICEAQIEKAGLSPAQWAGRFDAETVQAGTVAFGDAVLDFFPRRKIAQSLQKNFHKALERLDEETVRKIETAWASNGPAGNSPGSPGLTPDP